MRDRERDRDRDRDREVRRVGERKGRGGEDTGRDGETEVDSEDFFSYIASSALLKQFTSIIKYFDLCSSYTKCHEKNFYQDINKYVILKYIHCSVLVLYLYM